MANGTAQQDPTQAAFDQSAQVPDVPASTKEKVFSFLKTGSGTAQQPNPLEQAIAKEHQKRLDEARMHKRNAATAAGILTYGIDPKTGQPLTDEDRQRYTNEYQAAMGHYEKAAGVNKETKGAIQRARQIVEHMIQRGQQKQQAGGTALGPPQAGPPPVPQSSSAAAGPAGGGPPPVPLASEPPLRDQLPFLQAQLQRQVSLEDYKSREKVLYDLKKDEDEAKEKAKAAAKTASTGSARPANIASISARKAKVLMQSGKRYHDIEGNEIDVTQLPDEMGLKSFTVKQPDGSWDIRYEPFSPNQKLVTAGNQTWSVNPMDVEGLSQDEGTYLGVHNVPTTSTHTAPGITPSGAFGQVVTSTGRTPASPGIAGRTQGVTSPSAMPRAKVPSAVGGTSSGGSGAGGEAKEPVIPFAAAKQIREAVIPVREAASQIFGDPSQPSLSTMKDFSALANDAGSRDRLGTALTLTFDNYQAQEAKAGGLVTLLEAYGGVPTALANVQASIRNDAIKNLTPEEVRYYDSVMSAFAGVVGVRSLTKSSAALANVRSIERELPLVGINTANQKQYNDQLAHVAEIIYNGTRSLPMTTEEKAYYKKQVGELSSLSRGGPPPVPSSKTSTFHPF